MSLGKTVHVLSPKMAGIEQVILEVRAAIVSYINSSFLAKFQFPVREYTRRCNTVENIQHS